MDPAAVARSLGFADPRCLQSMVICKQPEIGGAVPPHQDSVFLYTDPPSAVGFWYALEDATLENGCLSFLPGSHKVSVSLLVCLFALLCSLSLVPSYPRPLPPKRLPSALLFSPSPSRLLHSTCTSIVSKADSGFVAHNPKQWAPISKRLVRKAGDAGTEMTPNEGPRFPPGDEYAEKGSADGGEEGAYVPGEVKAGSLVLIHGNLLHKSEKNLSQKGRIIYTFHVIEGGEGRVYDQRNWLQPPAEGFTRLYAS